MRRFLLPIVLLVFFGMICFSFQSDKPGILPEVGTKVDSLDGVHVFYNGKISHVKNRNVSEDGYNIGLRWQCVEFIKRYYYEALDHKMPNSYGHAKDFFTPGIKDGQKNPDRNLRQFTNPSSHKPQRGEIIIFDGNQWNPYGHVAIISHVDDSSIEIIQQNPGPYAKSRVRYGLKKTDGKWTIDKSSVLGRLGR